MVKDLISQSEFSEIVGVSRNQINRLLKEKKLNIKIYENKQVSKKEALAAWNQYKGYKVDNKGNVTKAKTFQKRQKFVLSDVNTSDKENIQALLQQIEIDPQEVLNKSKAKEQLYKAELSKINYLDTKNELISLADAERTFENIASKVKVEMQSIPQRVAGRLEGRDAKEIEGILEEVIALALENLNFNDE